MEAVVKSYPRFKYNQLISSFRSSSNYLNYDVILEDFEFIYKFAMSLELGIVLLNIDFLDPYCHYDCYCAWVKYYKILKYHLLTCNSCFIMLQYAFGYRQQTFEYNFKHRHEFYLVNDLHELYRKIISLCSICWMPLFELKNRDESIST